MSDGFGQMRDSRGVWIVGLASLTLVAGCRSGLEVALLRNNASAMSCEARELAVSGMGGDRYVVEGCGQRRTFHCASGHCERIGVDHEPRPTWDDDQVRVALRGVNTAVLACVPEREEIELEVQITRRGRANRWGRTDLPRAQVACVRRALAAVRLGRQMPTGRRVRFVFGGRSWPDADPSTAPAAVEVPPPPDAPPPSEGETSEEPADPALQEPGAET